LKVWRKWFCNFGFLQSFDYHLFHDFHLCLGRMESPTNWRSNVTHLDINVWFFSILDFFSLLIKSTIYVLKLTLKTCFKGHSMKVHYGWATFVQKRWCITNIIVHNKLIFWWHPLVIINTSKEI
jgi:hypothetical protein